MKFNSPDEVSQICWQFRQSDYARGKDRALIDRLFNGYSPYTQTEAEENNITINFNDLAGTRLAHDARSQFYQAFLTPGNFFNCKTNYGAIHNRSKYETIVTQAVNKIMKRSLDFFECNRSEFALNVLHGIGPAAWPDRDRWCPEPLSIADILIPANTGLTFKNMPFFAISRSYTAPELIRLTRGAKTDPAWNMELVDKLLKWIDAESVKLYGSSYPEIWKPEDIEERIKGSGGIYGGDNVPTIDTFDFWYWSDEGKSEGWRRRIILDDWNAPAGTEASWAQSKDLEFSRGEWLYNPKSRKYASKREEIFSCQFADLSAVAPFKYHSVRSLGFLLYSVCHWQNRLRCRFNECVFEAMTMYFRTKSENDLQRALKVNLMNRGFIDESLDFVKAGDRFQVNAGLVELGLNMNEKLMEENVSSYRQSPNSAQHGIEKTKFQVMAELNATTQLVAASLSQAYQYKTFQYREIFRRFCKKNSTDADILEFQAACLKRGVPEKLLFAAEAWEVESEKITGGGNKAMELAIAQQLMATREAHDPEAQRKILKYHDFVLTGNADFAEDLVPDMPVISNTIHDAQLSFAALMTGAPLAIKGGVNRIEVIQALLGSMEAVVQRIQQSSGQTDMKELVGLQNVTQHIAQNIQVLAQDETQKAAVKQFGDALGKMTNLLKGFAKNLAEKMKAQQQNGDGGIDAKAKAKLAGDMMVAKAKAANTRESHAARTAQKQLSFEQQMKQREQEHEIEMREKAHETILNRFKTFSE